MRWWELAPSTLCIWCTMIGAGFVSFTQMHCVLSAFGATVTGPQVIVYFSPASGGESITVSSPGPVELLWQPAIEISETTARTNRRMSASLAADDTPSVAIEQKYFLPRSGCDALRQCSG